MFLHIFHAGKRNLNIRANQCRTDNIENLRYDPRSNTENVSLDNAFEADNIFYNSNVHNLIMLYIFLENFQNLLKETSAQNCFNSSSKYKEHQQKFDNFRWFLSIIKFNFSIIFFSEKWLENGN